MNAESTNQQREINFDAARKLSQIITGEVALKSLGGKIPRKLDGFVPIGDEEMSLTRQPSDDGKSGGYYRLYVKEQVDGDAEAEILADIKVANGEIMHQAQQEKTIPPDQLLKLDGELLNVLQKMAGLAIKAGR